MSFTSESEGGKYLSDKLQFVGRTFGVSNGSGYFSGRVIVGPDDSKDENNRLADVSILQPYKTAYIWKRTA